MNVVPLHPRPHVEIASGLCIGGSDPEHIGEWLFVVTFVDEEGGRLTDYVGTDPGKADSAAVGWARDFGCRILDLSTGAPS